MDFGPQELVVIFLFLVVVMIPIAVIGAVVYIAVKKGTQAGQPTPPPGTPPA